MKPKECRASFESNVALEEREQVKLPVVQGYAAMFNKRTNIFGLFTESIRRGAFSRAIEEKQDVRSLFNHSADIVLGRTKNGTLVLRQDDKGLWTETTPPDTQQARDVIENVRVGNVTGMSFAFRIKNQEWTMSEDPEELDHREIIDVDLYDISVVTYPAYEETFVGLRSLAEDAYREAKELHRASTVQPGPTEEPHTEPPPVRLSCPPETLLKQISLLRKKYRKVL